jgi:DNA polymerase III epsilon subunit-like protein
MLLFFDTETDGLPRNWHGAPSDTANWPRILSIAWQCYDDDGKLIEESKLYLKHANYKINPESHAAKINGITQEIVDEVGVAPVFAILQFDGLKINADKIIAHNLSFDSNVYVSETYRQSIPKDINTFKEKGVCTMLHQKAIKGKWPKLIELHKHLFGEGFEGAHDALDDVRACARCYFELVKRNLI